MAIGMMGRLKVNALMGLMKLERAVRGRVLDEKDEFNHSFGSDRLWNESYYFNFFEHRNGLGGFTRIGILPNQKAVVGILALYSPDGAALLFKNDPPISENPDNLETGPLVYKRVVPGKDWKISFQGGMVRIPEPRKLLQRETIAPDSVEMPEVALELEFKGVSPIFDYHHLDPRAFSEHIVEHKIPLLALRNAAKVASFHYEQSGTVRGRIRIGSQDYDFQGSGHRDHSWGVRDWKAPSFWRWMTAQFGTELSLNLSRAVIGRMEVFAGFMFHDGKNHPIRRFELETEFEPGDLIQKHLRIHAEDVSGKTVIFEGEAVNPIPLVLEEEGHRTLVVEALTRYRWKNHECYGISEFLKQLG